MERWCERWILRNVFTKIFEKIRCDPSCDRFCNGFTYLYSLSKIMIIQKVLLPYNWVNICGVRGLRDKYESSVETPMASIIKDSVSSHEVSHNACSLNVQPHIFSARVQLWFCSCELSCRNAAFVFSTFALHCFNTQPYIFAVINCVDAALSVFNFPVLTCCRILLQLSTALSQRWVLCFSPESWRGALI